MLVFFQTIQKVKDLKYLPIRFLNIIKYRGKKVYCPCCENTYKSFMPYLGWNTRNNALCPNCFSGERHRLLMLFLKNKTNLFKRGSCKFLHTAPERCFYYKFKNYKNFNYYPIDIAPQNYPPGVKFMDLLDIKYPNNYFDVILSSHVLEHIEDDHKAIKELYRVLKNDGWAILQVPIDLKRKKTYEDKSIKNPDERLKSFGHPDHKRIYGIDFSEKLKEAEFEVKTNRYIDQFSQQELNYYGLMKDDVFFYVTKKLN